MMPLSPPDEQLNSSLDTLVANLGGCDNGTCVVK